MIENVQSDKYSKFVTAITKEAQVQRNKIQMEIDEYIKTETEKAQKDAYSLSETVYLRKTAKINEEIGSDFSQKELAMKQELFAHRKEICEGIFKRAADELIDFTKTDEYKDFIITSFKNIVSKFSESTNGLKIYLRESDKYFYPLIVKYYKHKIDIIIDENIIIGGIKISDENILINDTLDSRLSEQRNWFYQNSGLTIF